jgi:2-polyprenyl-3-methyl-5-hydroxy-6-metoxy-1,4-benzoquinol methylase
MRMLAGALDKESTMFQSIKQQVKSAAEKLGVLDELRLVKNLPERLREGAPGDIHGIKQLQSGLLNEIQIIKRFIGLFGFEKGSKAPYCRVYGGESTPLLEKLNISHAEYCLMHMVALINRMSPQRDDLFYIYDFALNSLDEAFPDRSKVGIVDLGCGHGQCGLAFALAGYHVYFVDVRKEYLDWAEHSCKSRGLTNYTIIYNTEAKSYLDRKLFQHPIAEVVEWSCFEHFSDPILAITWVKDILEKAGAFITTTSIIEWTEEKRLEYVIDCGEETTQKLMSKVFSSVSVGTSLPPAFDSSPSIAPGRYRVHTYYGRTERARATGSERVFTEVHLVPTDGDGVVSYRVSTEQLRALLQAQPVNEAQQALAHALAPVEALLP